MSVPTVSRRIVLHFSSKVVSQPVIYNLVKHHDLVCNIIKADIMPDQAGYVALEMSGTQKNYDEGIKYLKSAGVVIESLSQNVLRNEERCTHCGACTGFCPTGAFSLDTSTRKVIYDNEKCVACGLCIRACPPGAMEFHF
jgi:ferredoxin